MGQLVQTLKAMGCEMDSTMERFLNDENFYQECLKEMLEDPAFEKLGAALTAHEIRQSFEYAHMLKGIVANMGITEMYDCLVTLVEPLRSGTDEGLDLPYQALMEKRKKYQALLTNLK